MSSITYRNITIKEGDVFYVEGFDTPLTVRSVVKTKRYVALVSYGDTDFILEVTLLLNRILSGVLLPSGTPAYQEGWRFTIPTTQNTVTIQAVSARKALTTGSTNPQFIYFVQHIDANGNSTYVSLGERQLDGYLRMGSTVIRPFPENLENDHDPIDVGEIAYTP